MSVRFLCDDRGPVMIEGVFDAASGDYDEVDSQSRDLSFFSLSSGSRLNPRWTRGLSMAGQ